MTRPPPLPSCWAMSTGEAGMRAQVCGLAARVGMPWREIILPPSRLLDPLPGHLAASLMALSGTLPEPLSCARWPKLLISCGRRAVAAAILARKMSDGRVFSVYLHHPHVPLRHFDMLAPPRHDGLSGENVWPTLGALHGLSRARIAKEAERAAARFAHLPRPLIAVLIGGASRAFRFSSARAGEIAQDLGRLAEAGNGLIMSLSRRTGEKAAVLFRAQLAHPNIFLWDGRGPPEKGDENPYPAMLGLAEHILVTEDSVSMISEASASGKPVSILALEGGTRRLRAFHAMMREAGVTRPFTGRLDHWRYPPLDETGRIAAIVRREMAQASPSGCDNGRVR